MPSAAAEEGASRNDAECCKLSVQPRAEEASCRLGRERRLRVCWLNSPVSAAEGAAARAGGGRAPCVPERQASTLPTLRSAQPPCLLSLGVISYLIPAFIASSSFSGTKNFLGEGKIEKPKATSRLLRTGNLETLGQAGSFSGSGAVPSGRERVHLLVNARGVGAGTSVPIKCAWRAHSSHNASEPKFGCLGLWAVQLGCSSGTLLLPTSLHQDEHFSSPEPQGLIFCEGEVTTVAGIHVAQLFIHSGSQENMNGDVGTPHTHSETPSRTQQSQHLMR